MRRGVIAPCVVMGAGLSISCTVPYASVEVANASGVARPVLVRAEGDQEVTLAVDVAPGGVAFLESAGIKGPARVRSGGAEGEERSGFGRLLLEVTEEGALRPRPAHCAPGGGR